MYTLSSIDQFIEFATSFRYLQLMYNALTSHHLVTQNIFL
jgi:hypothetical protein